MGPSGEGHSAPRIPLLGPGVWHLNELYPLLKSQFKHGRVVHAAELGTNEALSPFPREHAPVVGVRATARREQGLNETV